jgi:hypothetical protein
MYQFFLLIASKKVYQKKKWGLSFKKNIDDVFIMR